MKKQCSPTRVMPPPSSVPVFMVTLFAQLAARADDELGRRRRDNAPIAAAFPAKRTDKRPSVPDRRHAGHVDMGNQPHARAELDLRADETIGPDLHAVANARAIGDARCRINRHLMPRR